MNTLNFRAYMDKALNCSILYAKYDGKEAVARFWLDSRRRRIGFAMDAPFFPERDAIEVRNWFYNWSVVNTLTGAQCNAIARDPELISLLVSICDDGGDDEKVLDVWNRLQRVIADIQAADCIHL